jgi:hypothetical protein
MTPACTPDSSPARSAASSAGSSGNRAAVSSVAVAAPTDAPTRRANLGRRAFTRTAPHPRVGHPPRRQRLTCARQLLDGGERVDERHRRVRLELLGLERRHDLA